MVAAKHLHKPVLKHINVLELVDHDVLQALLPLQADLFILFKNIQREFDQVIIVQAEAFFLLVQITVEDDVVGSGRLAIFLQQSVRRHGNQVEIVFRAFKQFLDFDHIPRVGEGHIVQGQTAFLINDSQHRINIGIVQNQEALRILHRKAVFLKD